MQIRSIAISNLLSFPHEADLSTVGGVQFGRQYHGGLDIFIGPNGSGKSNLLQIIDQVLHRGLYRPVGVDRRKVEQVYPEVISHLPRLTPHTHTLTPYNSDGDKPSRVKIELLFSDYDFGNMHFIYLYHKEINDLMRKFAYDHEEFVSIPVEEVRKYDTLTLFVDIDCNSGEMKVVTEGLDKVQRYLVQYCQNFFLVQELVKIYNYAAKKPEKRNWYALRRTTATLPSVRKINDQMLHTLWVFKHHADQRNKIFRKVNRLLEQYLQLSIDREKNEKGGEEVLVLKDSYNRVHQISELSGGQQGILFLIVTLLSYDLYKGLLIVDEPEVHLHPQLQAEVLFLIQKMAKRMGMQCLVATNSPFFVNEHTVYHVYRCVNYGSQGTKIIKPQTRLVSKSSSLIHILKYSASAKIFFVNKVILVEGETDEYFFEHYLRWLKNAVDRGTEITGYELININGKGSYKRWKRFLGKFGIAAYYIGDWDNISEAGVDLDIPALRKAAKQYYEDTLHQRATPHAQKYKELIRYIYRTNPKKTQKILSTIKRLYKDHQYILQWGAIETYLGLKGKGLDSILRFVRHGFKQRLIDKKTEIYRKELQEIFSMIFNDPVDSVLLVKNCDAD